MSIVDSLVAFMPTILAFFGVLLVGIVILLVLVFSDRDLNKGNNFYPTSFQIFALNIKLFLAPLVKGSSWKKLVRQDNPELNSDALTRVIAFHPNVEHIKEFKAICKLLDDDDTSIPFLYPAVVVLYPNCCLFAASEYPFPAVGSVHIYNTTTLYRKLEISEKYSCILKANNVIKHAKKGSEVEFISNLLDKDSKNVWINSSKFLIIHNQRKKIKSETWTDTNGNNNTSSSSTTPTTWMEPNPETDELSLLFEDIWILGANASIEYAAVSKDFNPIHTSSIAAKVFGFPGIIMHGMYMITRAASECQRVMNSTQSITYPLEISTKFQRPCVLPQKCIFKIYSMKSNKQHLYFTVKGKNDKILLDGYLHCTSPKKTK